MYACVREGILFTACLFGVAHTRRKPGSGWAPAAHIHPSRRFGWERWKEERESERGKRGGEGRRREKGKKRKCRGM